MVTALDQRTLEMQRQILGFPHYTLSEKEKKLLKPNQTFLL